MAMNEKTKAKIASFDPADDQTLVLAAQSGDKQAFGILATRYQRRIFEAALRYVRLPQDAEDIVQQAFEKAFIHLHSFEGKSSFSTWLTRIAINEALMSLRKGRARREVRLHDTSEEESDASAVEISDSSPDPEAIYLQKEVTETLFLAMKTLTPLVRTAIELRELAELSTVETARRMGLSIAAVKSRIFHGRAKLRKTLLRFEAGPKDPRRPAVSTQNSQTSLSYHLPSQ
jgi:RNA polymerase sigma-70 factor (ECF subfamily)